ncbi:MAG: VWA domain-containing protein [Candidatus Aenigmatarchaeota archaeon]
MNKGSIFTLDILLSITIIILVAFVFQTLRSDDFLQEKVYEKNFLASNDIISVISNLKVYEANTSTITHLLNSGVINDDEKEKSVLDLITSFWFSGNVSISENISREILNNFDHCVALFAENSLIYSSCDLTDKPSAVSSRIETGYEMGKPSQGYIARAFVTSIKNKTTYDYAFFGGYEGDGNITKKLDLPEDSKVSSVYIEGVFGNNFTFYINGNFSGIYNTTTNGLIPNRWFVCNQTLNKNYCDYVHTSNTFTLNFTGNKNNYVGGGYIRIDYNTSQMFSNKTTKIYLPGIDGIINLYSSFDVPGNLTDLEVYLHYKSNYTVFVTVGNKTVWRSNQTSVSVKLNDQNLSSQLDYMFLSNKTVPIRIGTEAFQESVGGKADVILITDISGSMNWRMDSNNNGVNRNCNQLNFTDINRISVAKCLDAEFVNIILNVSGNRVGLVGYSGNPSSIPTSSSQMIVSYSNLTTSSSVLLNQINNYNPSGATGICGSLRQAIKMLLDQSNSSRSKFIVLMTDGIANVQCNPSSQNSTVGCIPRICPYTTYCAGGGCLYSTCGDWVSERAVNDTIYEACRAKNHDITVYSIGFGPVSSCPISNYTLNEVAACGNGKYYNSNNATELLDIYRRIAGEIVSLSYETQRINITGNISLSNSLYPDSYIAYNYTEVNEPLKYGEITMTLETQRIKDMIGYSSNTTFVSGGFQIPNILRINSAKVTSYSSDFWTDKVFVKSSDRWINVFNLSNYNSIYQTLGDPFVVYTPGYFLKPNTTNYVAIGTGLSSTNTTGGSDDSKVIYEVVVNGIVGYGSAFNSSEFAIQDALNRLQNQVGNFVDIERNNIDIKQESISGIKWLWGPSLIKVMVWEK